MRDLELKEKDLFELKHKHPGANESLLNILGGLFLLTNPQTTCKVLCYIERNSPCKLYAYTCASPLEKLCETGPEKISGTKRYRELCHVS